MELLDKGNYYTEKIKQIKNAIKVVIGVLGILEIVSAIMAPDIALECFVIISLVGIPLFGLLYFVLRQHKSKLEYIDKMTDKFEEYTVRAQIISKSQESTTHVSGQQGYVSSSTSHLYMVGVRTYSGHTLTIYSESLYMSAREGEYVDVLIKHKLDKNDNLLDKSFTPLLNTISESI